MTISDRHQDFVSTWRVIRTTKYLEHATAGNRTLKSLRASLSKYALAVVTLVLKMTDNVQFKIPEKQTYFFISAVWLKLPGTYAENNHIF